MPNRILTLSKIKRNPITFLALGNSLSFMDKQGGGSLSATGALRYAPGSGGRINYAKNSSFEGTTNLPTAFTTATVTRTNEDAHSGSWSMKVVTAGTANNEGTVGSVVAVGTVGSGQTWTASVWVKALVGARLRYMLEEYDATGAYIRTNGATDFVGTGDWQQVSITKTLLSGVGSLKSSLRTSTTGSPQATTIYFDDECIEQTPTLGSYFDGSTAGCAWADPITGIAGTAHASPSISKAALWVEEGTTNLILHPSVEGSVSLTFGHIQALGAGATPSLDSTQAYFGSKSLKVVTAGAGVNEGVAFFTDQNLGYTGSVRNFTPSAYVRGSGNLFIRAVIGYTDASFTELTRTDFIVTDEWTRIIGPTVASNSAKTINYIRVDVRQQGTEASTFYVDGVQLEEKSYATSYCDGSLGTGYTWAGTAHASASTRANTNITLANATAATCLSPLNGALAYLGKRIIDRNGNSQPALTWGNYGTTDWIQSGMTSSTDQATLGFRSGVPGANTAFAPGTIVANTSAFVYGQWQGTMIGVAVDSAVAPTTTTRVTPTGVFANSLFIGSDGGNYFDGLVGPVAIFDRPLTDAERLTLAATDPLNWWTALA